MLVFFLLYPKRYVRRHGSSLVKVRMAVRAMVEDVRQSKVQLFFKGKGCSMRWQEERLLLMRLSDCSNASRENEEGKQKM